jgi:transposase
MARKLPVLGEKLVTEIEAAWAQPQEAWARRRLLVVRLIAQHELTVEQITRVAEVSRQSVFTYRDTLLAGGVAALLTRKRAPGRKPAVRGAVAQEFITRLEAGKFRQARDAQAWIKKRTHRQLTESGVRQLLRRVGGKLKVPRKSHAKKDPAKATAFKAELAGAVDRRGGTHAHATGPPVGARRAPLRSVASDPSGLGSARSPRARALRHPLQVGLPA